MSAWMLVACLVSLRRDINALAPGRDKRTDGAVADAAHSQTSDHAPDEDSPALRGKDADRVNEVHAIDVDASGPWPAGWSMERIVQTIVTRHRSGADVRLQNIIFNRRIWSRSWGWTARAYHGASPHTEHAHFSARYTTAQENDTSPWGLAPTQPVSEEDIMTKAEFLALLRDGDVRKALATAVLSTDHVIPAPGAPKPGRAPDGTDINTHWTAQSYLQNTYTAATQTRTAVGALAGKDLIDETALARTLAPMLTGVTPAQLQTALVAALRQLAQ